MSLKLLRRSRSRPHEAQLCRDHDNDSMMNSLYKAIQIKRERERDELLLFIACI